MRVSLLLLVLACGSSEQPKPAIVDPKLAIVGHGVQLVPAPRISASILDNGVMIFGPRADAPLPAEVKNVAVKPGKPPTSPLAPRAEGPITIYSDGATDTTMIATGAGMTTYDGILEGVSLSQRTGPWIIVSDGKDQVWTAGRRLDVADDGKTFKLVEIAK